MHFTTPAATLAVWYVPCIWNKMVEDAHIAGESLQKCDQSSMILKINLFETFKHFNVYF